MQWCIPACRCVSGRLTSQPLFSLILSLPVFVHFQAAVLPEQIIYCFPAVYPCFIKTTMVSFTTVTSIALKKGAMYAVCVWYWCGGTFCFSWLKTLYSHVLQMLSRGAFALFRSMISRCNTIDLHISISYHLMFLNLHQTFNIFKSENACHKSHHLI